MIKRQPNGKYIIPTSVILVIIVLVVTLVHFRKYSPYKLPSSIIGNPEIVLSLNDVQITGRTNGHKLFSFKSSRADVSRGRYTTCFYAIRDGELFIDDKPAAKVDAGMARYDSVSESVEINDGVTVSSVQGYIAKAESAMWAGNVRLLRCPGKVSFTAKGNQISGENLVADLDNQVATLEKAHMDFDIACVEDLSSKSAKTAESGGRN